MKHDHSAFSIDPPFDPRMLASIDSLQAASENGYPIVARRAIRKDRLGPAAGGACALLLGGITFWSMAQHREVQRVHPIAAFQVRPDQSVASTSLFGPPVTMPSNPSTLLSTEERVADTAALPTTAGTSPYVPAVQPDATTTADPQPSAPSSPNADTSSVKRGWAPILVVDGNHPTDEAPAGAAAKVAAASGDTDTAARMIDPSHTISQGSLIPAVLETAIDSDLPGYARAVVTRDVYSFDRSQLLIPRSSRLVGEYKSGLADGQRRVYVTWSRLIRPDGASIVIASPATSPSGGSGLPGKVNSHFIQRFGSAILLTVVGAASAIGSSGLVLAGSTSAASVAATHDAQIPPTIRIQPGQPLRVFTVHDLDFSPITAPSAS